VLIESIMSDSEQQQASQRQQKAKFPCLRCKKNVAKNCKAVRCGTCNLWVHTECEKISDELYNILAHPEKYGGHLINWTCDCCKESSAKIDQVVKAYTERVKVVETRMDKQDSRMDRAESSMKDFAAELKELKDQLKNRDNNVDKKVKQAEERLTEEMHEQNMKKNNVVMYRVQELPDERATGRERMEWDRKQCAEIFEAAGAGLDEDDIKFCRRVGERGNDPRPLVVGFHSEADKSRLLRKAKRLEHSRFKEVGIAQDLSKKQREAEANLAREAEKRNEELTDEDRAKNMKWAVVGARGEKRLIKTTAWENRYQHTSTQRGGQRGSRGRGGSRPPPPTRSEDQRAAAKRRNRSGEEEMEEDGQPPSKR
jgi:hypothetical protein